MLHGLMLSGRKALEVVVARARIVGNIKIDTEAPPRLEALVGQPIVVKFAAKAVESSKGKETFRFSLAASMDDQSPAPVEKVLHDRPVLKDETWLTIEQKLKAKKAGQFKLRFEVVAEYTQSSWDSDKDGTERELKSTRAGEILIDVKAP